MKQSFFFTFFIIIFPEGAIQRQYNYLLSTEEKKNWLILTTAIRMLIIKREKSTTE